MDSRNKADKAMLNLTNFGINYIHRSFNPFTLNSHRPLQEN